MAVPKFTNKKDLDAYIKELAIQANFRMPPIAGKEVSVPEWEKMIRAALEKGSVDVLPRLDPIITGWLDREVGGLIKGGDYQYVSDPDKFIKNFVETTKFEDLPESDIAQSLDFINRYQQGKPKDKGVDYQSINNEIEKDLNSLQPYLAGERNNRIATFLSETLRTQGPGAIQGLVGTGIQFPFGTVTIQPEIVGKLNYLYSQQTTGKELPPDFEERKNTLSDILSSKKEGRMRESELSAFTSNLPEELARSRNEFLTGETERAVRKFEGFIPKTQEFLNARGRLFGGGLQEILGQSASNIASELEKAQFGLETEDNDFYFNAAYNQQLRKSLEGIADIETVLGKERESILTSQKRNFTARQSDLDAALQDYLDTRNYERSLRTTQENLAQSRRVADERARGETYSGILNTLGQIGGVALASRVPASKAPGSVG